MGDEIGRALGGLRLLIFVVQAAADRVMRVVDFGDEIGDRQLQLVNPQPAGFVVGREPEPRAEEQQDVRGLPDDYVAGFQERRRERHAFGLRAVHHPRHRGHAHAAARFARDVDVVGVGRFEREPHVFAAALDFGPVIEFVSHPVLLSGDAPRDVRIAMAGRAAVRRSSGIDSVGDWEECGVRRGW